MKTSIICFLASLGLFFSQKVAIKGETVRIITSSTNATVTIRPEQIEVLH